MQIPYLNQILLLLVVTILTTLLTLSGIQVIHILSELRETMRKVNKSMDDFNLITNSVAKPVAGVSGFVMGLKSGSDVFRLFLKNAQKARMTKEEENE
jgi:flagellar biosynthesis protein FlhB